MHAFYFVFFFHMDATAKGIFLLFNVHLIHAVFDSHNIDTVGRATNNY